MSANKIELLRSKKAKLALGGGQERIEKQHAKGKMTARERLEYFFDDHSFIELDAFIKNRCTDFGMDAMDFEGESVVTGYRRVDDRLVYAFSQDFTVTGGAIGEMHARKVVKAMDAANRCQPRISAVR